MNFWMAPLGVSIVLSMPLAILAAILLWLFSGNWPLWQLITAWAICVLINWLAVQLILRYFIYLRLKQIYRRLVIMYRRRSYQNIAESHDIINDLTLVLDAISHRIFQEFKEMRELDMFRKEYIGIVSHELKTPIFAIEGFLETLLDGALEDNRVNRKFLGQALKNVNRINSLIRDLITISRLESGEIQLYKEPFRIYDVVLDVFGSLDSLLTLNERSVKLRLVNQNCEKIYVLADEERIEQVLVNLISNAITHGKPDGEVCVSLHQMGTKVEIKVIDNGPGIAPEHIPHIFERFYRVEQSRSRENGGTGLGLAIVKYLIDAHEEHITLESNVGFGTTFAFTLSTTDP
jgi:two-component system, OmpR family, phosphate regulon sensor histidine kinase PhoR